MTGKRFGMYQNTLYDDGNILNPFNAMKLLNHFDKENTKLKKENEQLKKEIESWKKHCITHGIAVPITWGDKND